MKSPMKNRRPIERNKEPKEEPKERKFEEPREEKAPAFMQISKAEVGHRAEIVITILKLMKNMAI